MKSISSNLLLIGGHYGWQIGYPAALRSMHFRRRGKQVGHPLSEGVSRIPKFVVNSHPKPVAAVGHFRPPGPLRLNDQRFETYGVAGP